MKKKLIFLATMLAVCVSNVRAEDYENYTYEETKTPFMIMENCCFDKYESMALKMVRDGVFGEILHMAGAYGHDLRKEISDGNTNVDIFHAIQNQNPIFGGEEWEDITSEAKELINVSSDIERDYVRLKNNYPIQYLIGYVDFYGYKTVFE